MTTDSTREGRQLAGAKTTQGERAGVEEIIVTVTGNVLQLDQAIAPAGDVRLIAINSGSSVTGLRVTRAGVSSGDSIASWARLEPGESSDQLLALEEGEYELATVDLGGDTQIATAKLIVQPQQGLKPVQGNRGVPVQPTNTFEATNNSEAGRAAGGLPVDEDAGQRVLGDPQQAENEESYEIAEAASDERGRH